MLLLALLAFSFAAVALVSGAIAAKVAFTAAKDKSKKSLRSATARWDAQSEAQAQGAGTVLESFTLGWFNLLLQSLWVPVLEKFVSALTSERLQILLNEVLTKNQHKAPWKYIESVRVDEVTFGLVPPQFRYCFAKYDPKKAYLQLQMDAKFSSSGFQAVLTPRIRQIGLLQAFNVRLQVTHLLLAGRLVLGIQLTQEPPGIKGIHYSFATEPEFDIQASPVGYLSSLGAELPGLVTSLRNALQGVINRRMVEPNRRFLDVQRIYRNRHVQRHGGPGGLLVVTVVGARDVKNCHATSKKPTRNGETSSKDARDTKSGDARSGAQQPGGVPTADCDPYVELRFGKEVFRTPIVHGVCNPVWNWQFEIRLPADLGSGTYKEEIKLSIWNALTVGDPEYLSGAVVNLNELQLNPTGETLPLLVTLLGAHNEPLGALQLQLAWLKVVKGKYAGTAAAAAPAAGAASAGSTTRTANATSAAAAVVSSGSVKSNADVSTAPQAGRASLEAASVASASSAHAAAFPHSPPVQASKLAHPHTAAHSTGRPATVDSSAVAPAGSAGTRTIPVLPSRSDSPAAAPGPGHLPAGQSPSPSRQSSHPSLSSLTTSSQPLNNHNSDTLPPNSSPPPAVHESTTSAAEQLAAVQPRSSGALRDAMRAKSHSDITSISAAATTMQNERAAAKADSKPAGHRRKISEAFEAALRPLAGLSWRSAGAASRNSALESPAAGSPRARGASHMRPASLQVAELPDSPRTLARNTSPNLAAQESDRQRYVARTSAPLTSSAGSSSKSLHPVLEVASREQSDARRELTLALPLDPETLQAARQQAIADADSSSTAQADVHDRSAKDPQIEFALPIPNQTLLRGPSISAPLLAIPSIDSTSPQPQQATTIMDTHSRATTSTQSISTATSTAQSDSTLPHLASGQVNGASAVPFLQSRPSEKLQSPHLEGHGTNQPVVSTHDSNSLNRRLPGTVPPLHFPTPFAGQLLSNTSAGGGHAPSQSQSAETAGQSPAQEVVVPRKQHPRGPSSSGLPNLIIPTDDVTTPVKHWTSSTPTASRTAGDAWQASTASTNQVESGVSYMQPVSEFPSDGATSAVYSGVGSVSFTGLLQSGSTAAGTVLQTSWTHNPFQTLTQVVRIQSLLEEERARSAALAERCAEAERKYEAMQRLRRAEGRRALKEGAVFLMLTAKGDTRRCVLRWVEAEGALHLTPDSTRGSRLSAGGAGFGGGPEWLQMVPVKDIMRVEPGTALFPKNELWSHIKALIAGKSKAPANDPANTLRCFSLVLASEQYVHLQLPPEGNGRSRDEWVRAFQELLPTELSNSQVLSASSRGLPSAAAGSSSQPLSRVHSTHDRAPDKSESKLWGMFGSVGGKKSASQKSLARQVSLAATGASNASDPPTSASVSADGTGDKTAILTAGRDSLPPAPHNEAPANSTSSGVGNVVVDVSHMAVRQVRGSPGMRAGATAGTAVHATTSIAVSATATAITPQLQHPLPSPIAPLGAKHSRHASMPLSVHFNDDAGSRRA